MKALAKCLAGLVLLLFLNWLWIAIQPRHHELPPALALRTTGLVRFNFEYPGHGGSLGSSASYAATPGTDAAVFQELAASTRVSCQNPEPAANSTIGILVHARNDFEQTTALSYFDRTGQIGAPGGWFEATPKLRKWIRTTQRTCESSARPNPQGFPPAKY